MKQIFKRILLTLLSVCIMTVSMDSVLARADELPESGVPYGEIPEEVREYFEQLGYNPDEIILYFQGIYDNSYTNDTNQYDNLNGLSTYDYKEPDFVEIAQTFVKVKQCAKDLYDNNEIVSGLSDYGFDSVRDNIIEDLSKIGTGESAIINKLFPQAIVAGGNTGMAEMQAIVNKIAAREEIISTGNLTGKTLKNFIRNTEKLKTENADAIRKYNSLQNTGKFFRGLGAALSLYSAYSDAKDLVTNNIYNQKTGLAIAERGLLAADCGLGLASAGLAVAGISCAPVAVAAIAVGIATAIIHNRTFGDAANNANSFGEFLDNLAASFLLFRKTPDGVGAYKPNIYFYNAQGMDIDVKMLYSGLITKSIPEYGNGWNVTLIDNQSRMLTDDGEEYGYLFYESMTSANLFQTEYGFYIDADERTADFYDILGRYGFNAAETEDFIEFWNVKLDSGCDYIMYPQYTDTVDLAMPVTVTPVPDNMVRMWFVFAKPEGQTYIPAKTEPFSHDGYTVVEWGGVILNSVNK